ncbi:hypothetical protein WQ54_25310 [Bacillus sp. SA1-12]|uniref:DUF2529 domain-containing protein n=1 Tax=Bacillus sp. SA1-12 TaxID=1455638 RepID=UPI0006272D59|nr:DUF2529 domain-containing protein [Bacillus sp. SA1-12]KKI89670.1 hypothetical protein WQ54_25310 [Bacillus sp. SA1-12]
MMKIFTTQLIGHLNRIQDQEEMNIEDSARLLAQALIGEGKLYIYGYKELHGVVLEAMASSEPLEKAEALLDENGQVKELSQEDRVLLFTYRSTDEEAMSIAKALSDQGIQLVGVSALIKNAESGLDSITDLHIDAKLRQPLIPDEDGERYGFPALMTSLYVFYALSFTIKEILHEYEDELL